MEDEKYTSLYKEVITTVDIVETISRYVDLKKNGTNYDGKCPFDERCGDSFCVNADKQSFYCFGCHSKGDVIAFIAKIGPMNRSTAAKFLQNIKISRARELKTSGEPKAD